MKKKVKKMVFEMMTLMWVSEEMLKLNKMMS